MPIYGYRCGECGHELEVLQSMSAPPLRECPECGGPLSKLLYPVGVQFKGSGFYTTDYKNGGGDGAKNGEKKAESESGGGAGGGGGEGSSEKKSDSGTESKPSKE